MRRKYKPGYYEIKPGARKGLIRINSYTGQNIFVRAFHRIIDFLGKVLEIGLKIILVIILHYIFTRF